MQRSGTFSLFFLMKIWQKLNDYKFIKWCYHCSPTSKLPFFLPRPPLPLDTVNLAGSKGFRLIDLQLPSKTSSAIAFPQAGAHAIPQQLWPALMKAPDHPCTAPMYGFASGGQGLIPIKGHSQPFTVSINISISCKTLPRKHIPIPSILTSLSMR